MKLRKVWLKGLKGQDMAYELGPVTVLHGPNGSGKTAVLQAIMFGILGYDPRLGKTADKIAAMMTEQEMQVRLEVDQDGGERFVVVRGLVRKNGGTRSTLRVAPSFGETTLAAAGARVEAALGAFPVMFDLSEFLALSHDRRRQFIFNLVAGAGYTPETLLEKLTPLLTDAPADLRAEALSLFQGHVTKELARGGDAHEVLGQVLAALKDQESAVTATVRQLQAGLQAVTDELGQLTTSGASQALAEEIETFSVKIHAATTDLERERSRVEERQRRHERLHAIAARKQELGISFAGMLEEMRTSLVEHEQKLLMGEEVLREARKQDGVSRDALAAATEREHQLGLRVAGLGAETQTIRRMIEGLGSCSLVEDPRCAFQGKRAELEEKSRALHEAIDTRKRLGLDVADATMARGRSARFVQEGEAALPKHRERVAELRKLVADRERLEAAKAAERNVLDEEERQLLSVAEAPLSDLEILEQRVRALEEARQLVQIRLGQVHRREALEKATVASRAALQKAERDQEVLKALRLAAGPRGLQGQVAMEALTPLATAANEVLSRLPAGKKLGVVTLNERGTEIFDLGWERDGRVVPFEVLSTGERLQFAAAISLGLVALRKPPLRILLVDDLQNVDGDNRGPFVDALRKIVQDDLLDNVVLASVVPFSAHDVPDMVVHQLGS